MLVTVALCTWNRARLLDQTLTQMRGLRVPPEVTWEVLVVNNKCTDDTDAAIARHAAHLPLRRFYEATPGHVHARNCALDHAIGDWIVWTDDDVLVDPGWLEGFAATVGRHPDATAIGGRVVPWFPVEPDPNLKAAFAPLSNGFCGVDHGPDERVLGDGESIFGANMAFHLGRTAGMRFDPGCGRVHDFQGADDDFEFVRRVRAKGGVVVWSPAMGLRHYVDPKRTTFEFMERWYTDVGEWTVRRRGVPDGPRIFGLPRWLLRRYVETLGAAALARLRSGRVAYLRAWQDHCIARGALRGCRAANQAVRA